VFIGFVVFIVFFEFKFLNPQFLNSLSHIYLSAYCLTGWPSNT